MRDLSIGQKRALWAWAFLALPVLFLVGVLVKLTFFTRNRSPGTSAVAWGIFFALYLWWGSKQVGLAQPRAVLLGVAGGVASAFFIYLRGAGAGKAPTDRPGAFMARMVARRTRRSSSS